MDDDQRRADVNPCSVPDALPEARLASLARLEQVADRVHGRSPAGDGDQEDEKAGRP